MNTIYKILSDGLVSEHESFTWEQEVWKYKDVSNTRGFYGTKSIIEGFNTTRHCDDYFEKYTERLEDAGYFKRLWLIIRYAY